MKIILNGEEREINRSLTMNDIFKLINIDSSKIMGVAVNMNILKKENWENEYIKENDNIEILNFVAGG